jgi:hypothetical protein
MLNNLTNFFNLIKSKRIKTELEPSDLIAIGTRQSLAIGDYKPTCITAENVINQIVTESIDAIVPLIPVPVDPAINYATVAWVDKTFGNDSTGELGQFNKPFATYQGALAAINLNYESLSTTNRALIYMRSGSYGNHSTMWLRSHIDTYCEPGVYFGVGSRIRDSLYGSSDGVVNCNWYGHASYLNPGTSTATFFELISNSNVHAEFNTIDSHSGPIFIGGSGTAYFKCIKIETNGLFQSGCISFRGSKVVIMDVKERIRSAAATIKIRQHTGNVTVNTPQIISSIGNTLGGNFKQAILIETESAGTATFNADLVQEDTETYFGGIGGVFTSWVGGGGNYTINGNIYANNSRAGIYRGSAGAIVKLNGSIITKRRAAELNSGITVFNNGYLINQNIYAVADPIVSIGGSAVGYFKDVSMNSGADSTNAISMSTNTCRVRMFNSLYSGNGLLGNLIGTAVVGSIAQLHNVRSTKGISVDVTDELSPTGLIVDPVLITPNFI